jgi:coronin-1B/1C/6
MGGQFTIKRIDEYGRIPHDTPTFKGHTAAIQDLEFSPFHLDVLATASADKTIKLWEMPPGKKEDLADQCTGTLSGHSKKVMLL